MTTFRQIRSIAHRSRATLLGDALGAGALAALMVCALYMPLFV